MIAAGKSSPGLRRCGFPMKVSETLSHAFSDSFQAELAAFLVRSKAIENPEELDSKRFLSRSIVPHLERLCLIDCHGEENVTKDILAGHRQTQ